MLVLATTAVMNAMSKLSTYITVKPVMHIFSECNQGNRERNEDRISVQCEKQPTPRSFLAVFDGHGGDEAATYASCNLWNSIKLTEQFNSDDPIKVAGAITRGFMHTNEKMKELRDSTWKVTKRGDLSTSGTTVACAIVEAERQRMFIANVGDSMAVLARISPVNKPYMDAVVLTNQHHLGDKEERKRIESLGGIISNNRVVCKLSSDVANKDKHTDAETRWISLNVSRSLGDFWSITEANEYLISPIPYIQVHTLDFRADKLLIIGTDGLWNIMTPQEVVDELYTLCVAAAKETDPVQLYKQGPHILIEKCLDRYARRNLRADNISVVTAFILCTVVQ